MIDILASIGSFFVALYFSTFSPHHTPYTECGKEEGLEYCYYAGDPASNRVVYFLHGFGNDRTAWTWNSVTARIEDEWKKNRTPRPHVVGLSFGKVWWFNPPRGESLSRFVTTFEKQKQWSGISRVLYGDSMGGHNSLRWAATAPELFQKLALICPAMPLSFVSAPISERSGQWPFNSIADTVITRNYLDLKAPFNNVLSNPDWWSKLKTIPKIHVIVSPEDHFGFYSGGKELQEIFRKNGAQVSFEEQPVRHCDAEAKQLATFLAL